MIIQFAWEIIYKNEPCHSQITRRAKVFGGWIVLSDTLNSESMTFVPDPEHLWEVEKD
jgi:hypothetical protein